MKYPTPGTFIRPVGALKVYGYCFEVIVAEKSNDSANDFIECKRWGWDHATRQPIDDGHSNHGYYRCQLIKVRDCAWRFGFQPTFLSPIYFRKVDRKGQQDLFI